MTWLLLGLALGALAARALYRRQVTVLWGAPPRILRDGRVVGFVCPTFHRAVFHAPPCRKCARKPERP